MIDSIKTFLHAILPYLMLLSVLVAFAAGIFRRAQWPLYVLAFLASQPNVWYVMQQQFPFGNSTMDLLQLGVLLGIFFNMGGFERSPSGRLLAAFMALASLAYVNSSLRFGLPLLSPSENPVLGDWKNYMEMIFLYFLVFNAIKTEKDQKTLLMIMAFVVFFIALREFRNFSESSSFSYDKRAEGPFWILGLGPNHLGAFMAHYAFGLLLGISLVDKDRLRRWLFLVTLLVSLYPLFFAYSRGAYLATAFTLVVYGLVHDRRLLIVVAVLAISWQSLLPDTVIERITMTETPEGQLEDSAAERLILWEQAKGIFEAHPVFGIGFNGFELTRSGEELRDTHNFYMKTACEQGVVGLVMLAALFLHSLRCGWRVYQGGVSGFQRALGLGFFGCVCGMLITNIFGDRFSYFSLGAFYWFAFALVDRSYAQMQAAKIAPMGTVQSLRDAPGRPLPGSSPA